MILLKSFPAQVNLSAITQLLWQHKVPHRVRFINDEQQLWLQDADQYGVAKELLAQLVQGQSQPQPQSHESSEDPASASQTKFSPAFMDYPRAWLRTTPITLLVVLVTVLVAVLSQLGQHLQAVAWFSFFPLVFEAQAFMLTGFEHLWQQPWRLISPVFLHFGWLHMVFNLLWWWELGRRIERQSGLVLVTLLLLTSVSGNVAQAWQVASLFGGLSGVIYGLLGYIWVMDRFNAPRYHLPQNILIFMLLWLLLGISGLFSALGFGAMANLAHIGGLLSGVGWGFLHTLKYQLQSNKS